MREWIERNSSMKMGAAVLNSPGPYTQLDEIEALVSEFEACTLPRHRWTHEAHLTIALWYLRRHPGPEATRLIREGIQRYNNARGIITTKESGYHETITLFFVWAIGRYLAATHPGCSPVELVNGLINGPCGDKRYPLSYYSEDRLRSWEARQSWVDPDLKPLD